MPPEIRHNSRHLPTMGHPTLRRGLGRPKLVGNHNRCWIRGRHAVLEMLRGGVWQPQQILVSPRCPDDVAAEVRRRAQGWQIPLAECSDADLARQCRAEDHQGLAARMTEFPYTDLPQILRTAARPQRWLILDGVQDSFNVGAMLRSALELGTNAVLLGTVGQSGVNSQVAHSSAGAINHLPIARVPALTAGVEQLKEQGIRIIAASEKADQRLQDVDWSGETAIVVGNEGCGVSADVWALCDERVRIPTTAIVGSLNAAVAAGICCYERWRQLESGMNVDTARGEK